MKFGNSPRARWLVFVAATFSIVLSLTVTAEQPEDDLWSTHREASVATSKNTQLHSPSLVLLDPNGTLPKVTVLAGDGVAKTYVSPRVRLRSLKDPYTKVAMTSTFVVTYSGFSPQAQAAFQAAVDVWSQLLISSVPIKVNAVWENLGDSGILGSAGPNNWATDGSYYYPIALAEAIESVDLNSGDYDINASFNSIRGDWYFGTDGNTPSGEYDLMSVVLHELGHGLGFIGVMIVDDGSGYCDGHSGHGCYYFPKPWIFDKFTEDDLGYDLLNGSVYPQDSVALGNVLQSGEVFFDGAAAKAANGSNPPELYAPGSWQQGSSYSHLDESVYGPGDPNSLMTPVLWSAEAVHHPGDITLGIFSDMGWEVVTDLFSDGFETNNTNAWSSTIP